MSTSTTEIVLLAIIDSADKCRFFSEYGPGVRVKNTHGNKTETITEILSASIDLMLIRTDPDRSTTAPPTHVILKPRPLSPQSNQPLSEKVQLLESSPCRKWVDRTASDIKHQLSKTTFLGHLFNFNSYRIYGNLTMTGSRCIMITTHSNSDQKSDPIKVIQKCFTSLTRIYVDSLCNPFYNTHILMDNITTDHTEPRDDSLLNSTETSLLEELKMEANPFPITIDLHSSEAFGRTVRSLVSDTNENLS